MHQLKEVPTRSCIGGNPMEQLSVELKERTEEPIAQFACIGSDRVKNRLDTGRRAPNHAKDVAGGRLLFERDSQLCIPRLLRFEQSRVLNSHDGLVGKSLEERDLSIAELSDFGTSDTNYTDRCTRTNQWDGQYGAKAKASRNVAILRELISLGLHIGNVNRPPIEDDTYRDKATLRANAPPWGIAP